MRSKTSYFNGAIFWKNTKRFWPLWAAYFVLWFLNMPIQILNTIRYSYGASVLEIGYRFLSSTTTFTVFMSASFSIASALAVFSFLYSPRSTGMMASLPIRREGLFLTGFLSGFVWLVASHVAVFLISVIVELSYGVLGLPYLLQWLSISLLELLLFYGLACFCAVLTGHKTVLVAVYAVLNFLAVVAEALIKDMITALIYGYTASSSLVTKWLSPVYALWFTQFHLTDGKGMIYDYVDSSLSRAAGVRVVYDSWLYLGLCAAAGVLMAVAALFIFRRRHMESASDVVAVRAMRPVFKYALTFACALILGDLLYTLFFYNLTASAAVVMTICMLFTAALGYFAAEMLLHKSYRVFQKSWKGYAVSAAVIILAVVACRMDFFGVERRLPEAQNVQSVTIQLSGDSTITSEEGIAEVLRLHGNIIDNKGLYEELGSTSGYEMVWYVTIRYELSGGGSLERAYTLYVTEEARQDPNSDLRVLDGILNSGEAVSSRNQLETIPSVRTFSYGYLDYADESGAYSNYTLTPREAVDLYYEGVMPDIQSGNLGTVDLLTTVTKESPCYLYLEFTDGSSNTYYNPSYLALEVSAEAVNTVAYLRDVLGIDIF